MKPIENVAEYEQLIAGSKPVLLEFYADWCPDCKALQPVLDDLSQAFEGKITARKIDVEKHQALASQYHVRSIPTMVFIKDKKVVEQIKGAQPKATLENKLNNLLTLN